MLRIARQIMSVLRVKMLPPSLIERTPAQPITSRRSRAQGDKTPSRPSKPIDVRVELGLASGRRSPSRTEGCSMRGRLLLCSTATALCTLLVPQTSTAQTVPTCFGREVTVLGATAGDDVLLGTEGNDVIAGLAGNDTIYGLGGRDVLCGQFGNDTVYGQAGNDRIFGNTGNDAIIGGDAGDYLNGGYGDDRIGSESDRRGVRVS
jgi:RTX calcium-binding nonapeptide repeat (4 copies)